MDDKRTLTLHILGSDRPAAPLESGQLVAIQFIKSVSPSAVFDILSSIVLSSLGEDVHREVALAMATADLDMSGLMQILTDLAKATADAADAANGGE